MEKKRNWKRAFIAAVVVCAVLAVKYIGARNDLRDAIESGNQYQQKISEQIEEMNKMYREWIDLLAALMDTLPAAVQAPEDDLASLAARLTDGWYAAHKLESGGYAYRAVPEGYLTDQLTQFCAGSYEAAHIRDAQGELITVLGEDDIEYYVIGPDCVVGAEPFVVAGFISRTRGTEGEALALPSEFVQLVGAFFG